MNGCSFQTGFTAKFELAFVFALEIAFSQRLHFKANRRGIGSSKKRYKGFSYSPPLERLPCFYITISENFKRFQYFNFEINFLKNKNLFSKNWSTVFKLKALISKTHHFYTKPPNQKPISRQIEWWLQNGPITKNRVLPVTASFFWKFY